MLTCRYEMRRIKTVQIQPRQHILLIDHAGYTGPTSQHELDHTDHTDHTDRESICPESCTLDDQAGIDYLSGVRNFPQKEVQPVPVSSYVIPYLVPDTNDL